ncbi:hypothetical protein FPV67DRAFT_1561376 [Lyophyllum atratum]|nr:hypothetical protein FPV67DRAFT_1561376 [Lyophyllum atratum]
MPTLVCTARASYKKTAGSLELTDSHLQWTQDGRTAPSVRVPYSELPVPLFCSKEGAAQVRLKLGLLGDDAGHNFTFISPSQSRTQNANGSRRSSPLSSAGTEPPRMSQSPPVSAASSAPPSNPPTPRAMAMPRALIPGNDPASDFRLRKKVLIGNPELGQLHRDLVMSGQITEAEFWDGREHLLLAQAASEAQKKGKPGQLVDPRPEAVDGGEIKIRITPQLAYSENVPSKLTEESFWKRYFQSKLFNAHRASIRSTAAQHVVKEDPILDKYLEREDDGLEPRRQRDDVVDPFTGNEKDITMQAGRQKGALPLIRKFNEHSERLLNSALGEGPPSKRQRLETEEDAYAQIELDDLNDPEASTGIVLEMQERQRYFEGRMSNSAADAAIKNLDIPAVINEAQGNVKGWETNLMQLKQERKPGDAALLAMTQNVAARLDVRSRKNDIPDGLLRQMTTCQTAANEFLRQFWSAVYPPPMELQTVMVATPAQRAVKAAKMVGYIAKTHEKVNALVKLAQQHGVDPGRVEAALKPVLNAVDQALAFHQRKTATTRP